MASDPSVDRPYFCITQILCPFLALPINISERHFVNQLRVARAAYFGPGTFLERITSYSTVKLLACEPYGEETQKHVWWKTKILYQSSLGLQESFFGDTPFVVRFVISAINPMPHIQNRDTNNINSGGAYRDAQNIITKKTIYE